VQGSKAKRAISRKLFVALFGVLVVLSACSSGSETASLDPVPTRVGPTVTVEPRTTPTATATPQATPAPTPTIEDLYGLATAPLGTFVVARPEAGIVWPLGEENDRREIVVYTEPFGSQRRLVDVNAIDGQQLPVNLTNLSNAQGVLVMRVIAGGPADEWLMVQAPTRPHDQFVWVRRSDFDFGSTSKRIEIDLADAGQLTVLDGDEVLLTSGIVQGRDGRETPVHLTYLQHGVLGESLSPAYGTAVLAMASFSEVLGTFGGGLPSNYLHGTNQPELMGQRLSSGEIRVPNDSLKRIIELTGPGTPVILFDSGSAPRSRQRMIERVPTLATTVAITEDAEGVQDSTYLAPRQLWSRCPKQAVTNDLVCLMDSSLTARASVVLTARPDAGIEVKGRFIIPVFDVPGGEPRLLLHEMPQDPQLVGVPIFNPALFGDPPVVSVIEWSADREWARIEAPVRPQRQSVWVRARDFVQSTSTLRFEIDLAGEGSLTLFDGSDEVVTSEIVQGRESRPTPVGATFVDGVIDGPSLSPVFGPHILSYPIYSEVLTTVDGGRLPKQAIHGTNQPELMGQRVSSGTIRVPNEVLSFIVESQESLFGARVVIFDSSNGGREVAIALQQNKPWRPAKTAAFDAEVELGTPRF